MKNRTPRPAAPAGVFVALTLASVAAVAQTAAPPATRPPTSALESAPAAALPAPTGPADALAQAPEGKPEKLEYRFILTGYKDNYFISGVTTGTQVKFQFSLKFDLWPNHTNHSVYFGYTQKSIWDLYTSTAFVDSNYNPEIFYGYFKKYGDVIWRAGELTPPFIESARVGVEHESNGRDGAASRSWNRIYGYAQGAMYFGTDHYVTAALKAWWKPFFVEANNADIVKYLGYGQATAVYGYDPAHPRWWGGGHVGVTYFRGWSAASHQGIESFVQWRPFYSGSSFWKFTPNIFAQLFTGYGEYLLDYNQKTTSFRLGVSLEDRVHRVVDRGND
jgi:phospholipase A1